MANIREVARQAGVSVATVSRVLNHPESVSPSTMKQVLETMKRLDYTPNVFARSLALNRSSSIGLIVNILNPLYPQKKGGGYRPPKAIIYCCVIPRRIRKRSGLSKYLLERGRGLVLTSSRLEESDIERIRKSGYPCHGRAEYGGRCQWYSPTTKWEDIKSQHLIR